MAIGNSNPIGYFFLGLQLGFTLAGQGAVGGRANGGDIRGRTNGGAQVGRQGQPAAGTQVRHGPDKFISPDKYTSEHTATIRGGPASTPPLELLGMPGVKHGPAKFMMAAPTKIIWGQESTE